MADNADRAAEIIENRLEGAIGNIRVPDTVASDPECEDCGIEIPQARRLAAPWVTTCIECQGIRENKMRHRR
ncbi:transcriptional regulator, TraR/DksA family [Modicisalibacter ilicicola DSM 19980]|uniref:Transcriptional regulator, TraR/DksA family n=1 Tax=Modicisalibacter ilicicola DSM 19980 TaxID=1121942 RepID=A0A1M4Y174_9GAMM|nr:TraR/DksA C4-type zinc finger protein [Halomonas ilicicola]SHE99577.1 transcriptional regulator, TraR/DksA family [Halomonas ilicicola DSM 19980]